MTTEKKRIAAPSVTKDATEKLLRKMYISNVAKRLRELNAPSDIDRKRWVWELIQNAKDTIAGDANRNEINVRIEIDGDIVKFRHDGNPFTADARFGLLYKYSEDKENQESTGRFGTGFLTTHCLSKVVGIESNMFTDDEHNSLCGFSVTMYRDGQIEKELLEGLDKMQESEEYFEETFDWTTFTYHISTESGRKAVKLGIENFHDNIAQTMLFCKELASIELNDNGKTTRIIRKPVIEVVQGVFSAEFEIQGEKTYSRRFLCTSFSEYNKELSERYRADRNIRLDAAIEVDSNNNIVDHGDKTSHYCVLPLVGIESQLNEPLIINSPDFEPDSERQSLLLSGQIWNEENNNITETGINQTIYSKIFPLYEKLVEYLSTNSFGNLHLLANGLKRSKEHDKLDKKWYVENVIAKYRNILANYPVVEPYVGENYKKLSDCIIVKESKAEDESTVFDLLTTLYPDKLLKENHQWAQYVWKEGINLWNTEDLCIDIESANNWNSISLGGESISEWYNKFLAHVYGYDERILKEHALLPNMNGNLLKKDAENFKQGEKVSVFIIELLEKLGKDIKPMLLHNDITAVTLDSKYNSQSYSADVNKLAKAFIDSSFVTSKLEKVLPLLSVLPTDKEKYTEAFINQRQSFFDIAKSLYSLTDAVSVEDNSLLDSAWKELDIWFVTYTLSCLKNLGDLARLPEGLDAKWLNDAIQSMKVEISRLNTYEVLPNQNGKFCAQKYLYEDNGVPESLKNEVFDSISLKYKDILLHQDIDASSFAIVQKKNISSFASELKSKYGSQSAFYSSYPYSINGRYFQYTKEALNDVALYVLSILPSDKETEVGGLQHSLYSTATNLLGSELVPLSNSIDYSSKDLWQDTNFFIVSMISEKIKNAECIDTLQNQLGDKGENYLFEQINAYYNFLVKSSISYNAPKIFPNQQGRFCSIGELKKEEGNIGDIIKDIIHLLVDEDADFRNVLMDPRCEIQPQATLNSDDAYSLIDQAVADLYKNPEKWKDEDFIEAAQKLIEDWGDRHKGTFEEKFPRIFDDKEKILMNVVWKKERRELLMTVNNKLTEDQIRFVIENSANIKELSDTNMKLSNENEELKKQNEDLKRQLGLTDIKVEEENDILKKTLEEAGIENPISKPEEVQVRDSDGNFSMVPVRERQYSGLSSEEIVAFVSEAKRRVIDRLKELNLGYTFIESENAWNSYSQLYGVYDSSGKMVPIVVHSYLGPEYRYFDLNWYDLQFLRQPNSMLWVLTRTDGLQCIPMYALPYRNINIPMHDLGSDSRAKLMALAIAGSQDGSVGFEFGNQMPVGFKTPQTFNSLPAELTSCVNEISRICSQNLQSISKLFVPNPVIGLISDSDYANVIDMRMRELHDLPADPNNELVKGASADDML